MAHSSTQPSRHPWWTATVSGMANYVDSATVTAWSTVAVIYQQLRGLTPAEIGLLAGTLTLSVAFGALAGGRLGDRVGRRPVFIATMTIIIIGSIVLLVAPDFPLMLIATLVTGVAVGADQPVAAATISESAPDHLRARLLGFTVIFWMGGVIASAVLAAAFGDLGQTAVYILLGHVVVVTTLTLVGRLMIPESPVWLKARADRTNLDRPVRAASAVADLLRAPYRAPFLALLAFTGLAVGATLAMTQLATFTLVNVAGASVSSASFALLATIPAGVAGALGFMKTAGGPRRFLYFTIAGVAIPLAILIPVVVGFSYTTFVVMLVFLAIATSFAGEGLVRVWTQKSFPTLVRTTAQGSAFAAGRLVAAGLGVLGPILITQNVDVLLVGAAILTAIGVAVAWIVFRTWDSHDEFAQGGEAAAEEVREQTLEA